MNLLTRIRGWLDRDSQPDRAMIAVNLDTGGQRRITGDEWTGRGVRCPDCASLYFFDGPHGGSTINVKCAGCGACYWYGPPLERIDDGASYGTEARLLEDLL